MITNVDLTQNSVNQLQDRNLTVQEINSFASLLAEAEQEMESSGKSPQQILQEMDPKELALLQKASLLLTFNHYIPVILEIACLLAALIRPNHLVD